MKSKLKAVFVLLLGPGLLLAGCSGQARQAGERRALKVSNVILATTTSTQDTGLLDVLVPAFEKRYPQYRVKTIAVGTGEALAMGRRGEADVLLAHAPQAEAAFMAAGFGASRLPVMHNWFELIGLAGDAAGTKASGSVVAAFAAIARAQAAFVSRGDQSGTHKKELSLWEAGGVKPSGGWYLESGQGMAETLRIADEKQAYTLTDEGTYLALKKSLSLVVVRAGDKELKNPYSAIVVNGRRFPRVNERGARTFSRFITSSSIQSLIGRFGRQKYGKPLFTSDAR